VYKNYTANWQGIYKQNSQTYSLYPALIGVALNFSLVVILINFAGILENAKKR